MTKKHKTASFWSYYKTVIVSPFKAFKKLVHDERHLKLGFLAVLIPAAGYTLFYIMAYSAGGAPSTFKPWLALPIEDYFFYDIFIVAPSMFLCWIFSSGVVQILSHLFKGEGTYEQTASVLGFGISVATWSTLFHDLSDAFLGAIGAIDLRAYEAALNAPTFWRGLLLTLFAIYFAWFLLLFSKGIRAVHGLSKWNSFLLACIALISYQGVFLIFNR